MSFFQHHVFICCNQRDNGQMCCNNHGASKMFDYAKAKVNALGLDWKQIRINKAGCLGRCDVGPVMVVYPDETWYTFLDESDIDEIIDSHLLNGKPVERLKV